MLLAAILLATNMNVDITNELVAKYGEAQRPAIERGVRQVRSFWRAEDGDDAAMAEFIRANYAGDPTTRDALFERMEFALESLGGHMHEISRDWRRQSDLDVGPVYPFDELMAGYDPAAHVNDDLFANKFAFIVLLNFPITTLEERLANGDKWSRRQWAETKLAEHFSKRIPASVNADVARASAEAAQYVATYNVWMHHVVTDDGRRLFPPKMRLLEHWNLRDQIKADYNDPENGLAKQRLMQRVMERIVDQSIPAAVDDSGGEGRKTTASNAPEPNTRYAMLLKTFHAAKLVDPYSPTAPTHIARRFDEDRQLPEARVRAMLDSVLTSPLIPRVAKLIQQRLGRPLEPFDIWYAGFRPRGAYTEAQLDEMTRRKYPTPEAYHADMPNLFRNLGFDDATATMLANNIVVDPARGSGHAMGAERRGDQPHLRTRVGKTGMDYKGYNIAVHEMGHNVEQTFSLNRVDHTLLAGVPNTAFTEALAFVLQNRDLELLGLAKRSEESRAMSALNELWGTYEIGGVALVDMSVWHWMYDHPEATPAQLRDAVVQISKDVWNRYYAPIFNKRDVVLLGVYAHMIDSFLYLPDYPIGHMIAYQIEEQMEKTGAVGKEFERMARMGSVTPDLWMRNATGAPVGPDALLHAAERALGTLAKK